MTSKASQSMHRRLRILHCIDNFGIGGTELNAIRTLESLDRSRFELAAIALNRDGPMRGRYNRAGIPVHVFPLAGFYRPTTIRRAFELISFIRQWQPHVVHCHDMYTNMFVTPCARAARVPLTITSRRWWTSPPRRVHRLGNHLAYRISHLVLANSPSVAQLLKSEGVDAQRIIIISNFLDDAAFDELNGIERDAAWRRFGIPCGAVVCVAVTMLRPEKDLISLVRAVARLASNRPEIHLLLIGAGPCEAELKAESRDLCVADRIHFAGCLPNVPNPHQFGDISVLCSLHEGFPNSVIEAMAAGKPVVATAVGGVPDAIQHGVTGMLVPPRAVGELADALDLLIQDEEMRRRLGAAGRAKAHALYRREEVLAKLASLYLERAK